MHQGLPVYTASNSGGATPAVAGNLRGKLAQALPGQLSAVQPRKRPFPQLSTFQSIVQLHNIATHGDEMKGTPSFAQMQASDPDWRKNFRQRFHEFNGLLQEISMRGAQGNVSAERVAADMEHDRKEKQQQVATYVKEIGKLRANRKRGNYIA